MSSTTKTEKYRGYAIVSGGPTDQVLVIQGDRVVMIQPSVTAARQKIDEKQSRDSLASIFRDAVLPGPIALPDEDVAEHAAIHEAIEQTGIRPDSWRLADSHQIFYEKGDPRRIASENERRLLSSGPPEKSRGPKIDQEKLRAAQAARASTLKLMGLDADFYSIYEEDGKFYLNAGGSVRGPFQTRQEAVMAKKTGDGPYRLVERNLNNAWFLYENMQTGEWSIWRDPHTLVRKFPSESAARSWGNANKGSHTDRGDSLSAIARDALIGDCWYVPGQEPATGVYSRYNAGDSLSAIARDALDVSEGVRGMMERKAAKIAEAKAGEDRLSRALERVKSAQKIIRKRGDTPYNGYAANAEYMVKMARAAFGLAVNSLNNGALYKHEEMMQKAVTEENKAMEAVSSIERQANSRDALTDLIERATSGLREQTGDARETAKTKKIWKDLEDGRISRGEAIKRLRAEGLDLDYIRAMLDG